MKKIFMGFFIITFCVSASFADDGRVVSRNFTDLETQIIDIDTTESVPLNDIDVAPIVRAVNSNTVPTARVATTSRAVTKTSNLSDASTPTVRDSGRVSRATSATSLSGSDNSRGGSSVVSPRGAVSRSVVSSDVSQRDATDVTGRAVNRGTRVQAAGQSQTGRNADVSPRSSVGISERNKTPDVNSARVATDSRNIQSRASVITRESITDATERLEQTATLNKSCQQQYNDCMDQFCGVIDANQKRCSCSANLSRYTKVETAVKDANVQLNEVAQRIRYIGLSADEIRAIMNATEAESVLDKTTDKTESRNMLDEIEKLIKNPTSAASNANNGFSGLDMDLDFSSDGGDIFNLDFFGGGSSSGFSNLRGTELYNAAKKRCNTVLNQCKGAGATTQQITGNYDLAIDKDCIAYEQGLHKMNETLKSNVRSAGNMLQKARLEVLKNKNQYDAKGCISALNTCMMDDMVCGADYTKCLDPTKRYIDENGTVVLGQRVADITDFMLGYNNAAIDKTFLSTSKNVTLSVDVCKAHPNNQGQCIVKYLLEKIGTGATVTEGGLCRAVLDKCQRFSYVSGGTGAYDPYNDIVVNYVQRAMVNIQAAQQRIISDYASNCMVDIASCYNQQVSQVNAWSSSAGIESIYNVMRGACRNVALTCAYAVFAADTTLCPLNDPNICINNVSEMFYQSLLCPDNSSYTSVTKTAEVNPLEKIKYVNERCKCNSNFVVWGNICTLQCGAGTYRNSIAGTCDSCPGGTYSVAIEASACVNECPAGNYCPAGTSAPKQCPAGSYCPSGASSATKCPDSTPNSPAGSTSIGACS